MQEPKLKQIERDKVVVFEKTEAQLEGFFEEIGNLAKKKPDGAINKFKLGFINQMLQRANSLLDEHYRPFPDFEQFDVDTVLTTSDVVTILSQYLRSMDQFRKDYITFYSPYYYWNVEGADPKSHDIRIRAKRPKNFI